MVSGASLSYPRGRGGHPADARRLRNEGSPTRSSRHQSARTSALMASTARANSSWSMSLVADGVQKVLVSWRVGREAPWTEGRDVWWHEAASETWTQRRALRGSGRERNALRASTKRQGRGSPPTPMRGVATMRGAVADGRGRMVSGGFHTGRPLCSRPMPRASVSRAGPLHRRCGSVRPRRDAISSRPAVGSRARNNTAAPTPSASHETLAQKCIP